LQQRLIQGLLQESQAAANYIAFLEQDRAQIQQALQFVRLQVAGLMDEALAAQNYIHAIEPFVLTSVALGEFSAAQDQLIEAYEKNDYFQLFRSFENWGSHPLPPEFMQLLSAAYLKLSEQNPLPQMQVFGRELPKEEQTIYERLAMQRQKLEAENQINFERPSVPLPPIPGNGGVNNGMAAVRSAAANGQQAQALGLLRNVAPSEMFAGLFAGMEGN
jgi:hypothetical protein